MRTVNFTTNILNVSQLNLEENILPYVDCALELELENYRVV